MPVNGVCGCPSGQTRQANGQCGARYCRQAELTIQGTCICGGDMYDTGGQCVKRCLSTEIPDGYGGCKIPTADDF